MWEFGTIFIKLTISSQSHVLKKKFWKNFVVWSKLQQTSKDNPLPKESRKTVCKLAVSAGFTGVRSPTVHHLSGEADYWYGAKLAKEALGNQSWHLKNLRKIETRRKCQRSEIVGFLLGPGSTNVPQMYLSSLHVCQAQRNWKPLAKS